MLWKIYFWGMVVLISFTAYFQLRISRNYNVLDLVNIFTNFVLLFGGYSYVFKQNKLTKPAWQKIFKGLMVFLGINILYQLWPSNYRGDFSLINAYLLTNLFAYLLVLSLYLPLYLAIKSLAYPPKKK